MVRKSSFLKELSVRRVHSLIGSDRGSSLIEFALVLPMMMVLITGMCSVGIAINNYIVLTNAVGAGARAFAISPSVTITTASGATQTISDPCQYATNLANQAAPVLATNSIAYTITYTPASATGTAKSQTYTNNTCSGLTMSQGDSVQLKGVYSYTLLMYGFTPSVLNITAQSTELVQ